MEESRRHKKISNNYILVRQRYRNSVNSSWSYPGADVDSDVKPWITTAIMEKMQARMKWKNKNTEEGKEHIGSLITN